MKRNVYAQKAGTKTSAAVVDLRRMQGQYLHKRTEFDVLLPQSYSSWFAWVVGKGTWFTCQQSRCLRERNVGDISDTIGHGATFQMEAQRYRWCRY